MRQTHEQQADSWTNLKGKHAQGPGATSLYPANMEGHGPEVKGKGGCGLVVRRGEKIYSRLLPKPLLGGTSCWDDKPPKRGNLRGSRWVHALRMEREGINVVAGRNATTYNGIKQVRLCLARVGVAQCGQQVHPDQIKAVKG